MAYDNVTIRMGADASQAIREIGRVKKAVQGIRSMVGGSIIGMGLRQVAQPVQDAFMETLRTFPEFNAAMDEAVTVLREFGVTLARELMPAIVSISEMATTAFRFLNPKVPQEADETQSWYWKYLTEEEKGQMTSKEGGGFMGPMPPFGFEEDRRKREKNDAEQLKLEALQVDFQRRMATSLEKTQMLDPW